MLCQHCQKRVANVHFTQIVNNNKVEMYLCEQCAKEKGKISFASPLNANDFFSGLMGYANAASSITSDIQSNVCEKCGMSYEEFQKVGKLGCSNCYTVYGDKLSPLLKRIHGSVEHHGKVPHRISEAVKATREVEKLKLELGKAIQEEEYEKAAQLRDRIKSLEAGKKDRG